MTLGEYYSSKKFWNFILRMKSTPAFGIASLVSLLEINDLYRHKNQHRKITKGICI